MSRPTPGFVLVMAVAAGAGLAAAALAGTVGQPEAVPTRLAVADALVLHSIEGGVQASGYIDGRPVPSGLQLPIVIRWQPRDQAAPPARRTRTEASLALMP